MNGPELRLPPHSIEAEQSIIGALLLDSGAWDRIAGTVTDGDFFRDDHRRIFRHIAMICERGESADVVTVYESIEKSNEVDQTGGMAYLGEIANATPSAASIRRYASIIRERAALRRLQAAAGDLQAACSNPGSRTAAELAGSFEVTAAEVTDHRAGEPLNLATALGEALAYIDTRGELGGLRTGYRDFDAMTGGLEPGQLIIIAARPSVGKTIAGTNIAGHVAGSGGAVLLHTLEMTTREIGMRILAARSGVSMASMRAGTKDDEDWARMSRELPTAEKQRLFIDDTASATVAQVRARARRIKRKAGGLDLIIIDYLGLMRGQGDNRVQEIGSISRGLKALAKELLVPIIALAQLNRGAENRTDKRPLMSDLRDSGEIEQDADIVAMLHREELYNKAPEWRGVVEMLVRKNRNGPIGDLLLSHFPTEMRFADYHGPNPRRLAMTSEATKQSRGFD